MVRRIAMTLEYDGTAYAGFQRQLNVVSIQSQVEDALERLIGTHVTIWGAGRTDAGVHAEGQVIAFDTHGEISALRLMSGLNHYLPDDIAVIKSEDVALEFDPRRHATSRVYRYSILLGNSRSPLRSRFIYRARGPLDIEEMGWAFHYLEGYRDFAPFSGMIEDGKSTHRYIYRTHVWGIDDMVHLEIEGSSFLPQQMRRMVGAVLRTGQGVLERLGFMELADSGDRGIAHWVLPAKGLCLRQVKYRKLAMENHGARKSHETYSGERNGIQLART
jgi:tRNA pseudouridine38-40 synthase